MEKHSIVNLSYIRLIFYNFAVCSVFHIYEIEYTFLYPTVFHV